MSLSNAVIGALPVIEAELPYIAPVAGRAHAYAFDPPAGTPRTNIESANHLAPIRDVRPVVQHVSLDENGFAVLRHRSVLSDFGDEAAIKDVYYPESEALLKQATGADRVFIFDHTLRHHVPGAEDRRGGLRQPSRRVHVDQTLKSGPQRVRDLLPDEADELLKGRVQIINLWRPLKAPVHDAPLGVCDARSVEPDDLIPTDLIYRDRVGEIYSVRYNPAHRWFYLSGMGVDEALLLKCYDSATDGRARFAPHSAFTDPTAPADAPPRESIELRALVFHRA